MYVTLGLDEVYGAQFDELYHRYEREGRAIRVVKARELWHAILDAQIETGTPYMLYKDACNSKSNQRHLGTIKCSNLCTEIIEYTSPDEIAVCNLASLVLPKFVRSVPLDYKVRTNGDDEGHGDRTNRAMEKVYYSPIAPVTPVDSSSEHLPAELAPPSSVPAYARSAYVFDHDRLHSTVKTVTRNLNKIIDINFYPVPEARVSNFRHRPIGLGVQGLADVFQLMHLPFDSEQAQELNVDIFETIYHAALEASNELAVEEGVHSSYDGSPASQGLLQFDLWELEWKKKQQELLQQTTLASSSSAAAAAAAASSSLADGIAASVGTDTTESGSPAPAPLSPMPGARPRRWDWSGLKQKIQRSGLRNSLLTAPMPTASTAQILGYNECIEPYTRCVSLPVRVCVCPYVSMCVFLNVAAA